MKALLFGSGGQVGAEILGQAGAQGIEVAALGRDEFDFDDAQADLRAAFARKPDVVINAAAYTMVDKAESDAESARRVNAGAPRRIAEACAEFAAPLIHFSTDYVFDGRATAPYRESDRADPINVYGATKLEGERAIAGSGARFAILRLSWVFSARRTNFVTTMLRLGRERRSLKVVADQRGKPTPAAAAADAALLAARELVAGRLDSGVYHFAGDCETSWADFAEEIFRAARMDAAVERIPASDYPRPAPRPAYSVLDTTKFERACGARAPDWKDHVARVVAQLAETES